ncbi:uroporphyrinogen-III C-methyltransferase [Sporolactobacillus spathodeae]|uniref:uroporphyrinogen-III C-methyltransferase n=1 Tax=Sporolactobacillus spathodeae TaxID=1465502 RepID=A0ABS2QAG1_9BACL|nr:uroporphyrinogen-III C-methyltransferase [Sporolactobacillus spathodeae]MBM7658739.1 uroporphyrin-III C-methyltransferase [Sporolactobacillus spathodeae]
MGKVYLIGAGPGDPELITMKGFRLIQSADVILYDRLVNEALLDYAPKKARRIFCGKAPQSCAYKQEEINDLLVHFSKNFQTIIRLKGGDPFIFGRGGEEAAALALRHIPFEIVPGITAGIGVAAYAGIPVTHRQLASSVAFVTGHSRAGGSDQTHWAELAHAVDTLAVYMGIAELPHIVAHLITGGKKPSTPCAVIEWGTTIRQRTVIGTLATISGQVASQEIANPAMIIVGSVVNLREKIKWFEDRGLPSEIEARSSY